MRFKLTLFLVSVASLWQIWYRSKLLAMITKPVLDGSDYQSFLNEFRVLFLWAGFLLLLTCFFSPSKDAEKTSATPVYYWIGSFAVIVIICAGLILAVNPEGRFPWSQRKSYTAIAAHAIKSDFYQKLRKTPDIVLFGSSISFTTPAGYFKKKWGASAFNMSFNGGGSADFLRSLNYIIQRSPDGKTPSVVLVEILSPNLRIGNPQQTPLTILPYLPPDQMLPATGAMLDSLVLGKSFSTSIFTSAFIDTHRWRPFVKFAANGTGLMTNKQTKKPTDYELAVKNDLGLGMDLLSCPNQQLNPQGQEYIKQLVELARMHRFSIVFYRPPVNNDLYTFSNTKPARYQNCRNLFNTFIKTFVQKNPNIFYRDLSDHPKISKMGLEIYLDTHHVNAHGGELILQALNTEINAAITWSRLNHK